MALKSIYKITSAQYREFRQTGKINGVEYPDDAEHILVIEDDVAIDNAYNLGRFDSVSFGDYSDTILRQTGMGVLTDPSFCSWQYSSQGGCWVATQFASAHGAVTPSSDSEEPQVVSSMYKPVPAASISSTQNSIAISASGELRCNNGSTTTPPSGVIQFKLAEAGREFVIPDQPLHTMTQGDELWLMGERERSAEDPIAHVSDVEGAVAPIIPDAAMSQTSEHPVQNKVVYASILSPLTAHTGNVSNPHGVTKKQVGLEHVDDKSEATIKSDFTGSIASGNTGFVTGGAVYGHTSNTSNPHNVTKKQVGLEYVVNTGDSSTPAQNGTDKFTTGGAYALKSSIDAHKADYDNPHKVTKAQVGLGNVADTGDSGTPASGGTQKFTTGGAYVLQQAINAASAKAGKVVIGGTEYTATFSDGVLSLTA